MATGSFLSNECKFKSSTYKGMITKTILNHEKGDHVF